MLDHSDARACEDFAYTSGDYVSTAGAVIETDAVHPEAEAFAMEITPCDVYNWGLWQCPPVWRLEPTLRVPFNWEIDNGKLVNKAQAAVSYQAGSTTPDWTEFRLFLWHTFDNPIAVLQIPFDGENQT